MNKKGLHFFLGLFLGLSFLLFQTAFAGPEDNTPQFVEYLAREKINLTIAINAGKMQTAPSDEMQLADKIQENLKLSSVNRTRLMQLQEFLKNQKKQEQQYQEKIKYLQQYSGRQTDLGSFQEKMARLNNLSAVNKKTTELVEENILLTQQYEKVLAEEKKRLQIWKAKFQLDKVQDKITANELFLSKTLQSMYQQNIIYQQQKSLESNPGNQARYDAKILLDNLGIILVQQQLDELQLKKNLHREDYLVVKSQSVKTLQSMTDAYREAIEQFKAMEDSLKRINRQLERDQYMLKDPDLEKNYLHLQAAVKNRIISLAAQQKQLVEDLDNNQKLLKKEIATRQSLSEYTPESWPLIASQLIQIPKLFYEYCKSLVLKVRDNYVWLDTFPMTIFWFERGCFFESLGIFRFIDDLYQS